MTRMYLCFCDDICCDLVIHLFFACVCVYECFMYLVFVRDEALLFGFESQV